MANPRSADGSRRARFLLLALALSMSCGEPSATEPSVTNRLVVKPFATTRSVFVQEPTLMTVPTYDGSGQSVHPDVVAFDQPWHGARYWMTMTPYPQSNQTLENPSILTSDDGSAVSVPDGLRNPVVRAPRRSKDYNSDPELLYDQTNDRLVLFYRLVANGRNTLHVSTSQDGLTWSPARTPLWEPSHRAVSPTIAPRYNAQSRMWYVNAGKAGCSAKATSVMTRRAMDPTGDVVDTHWNRPILTDLKIPGYVIWHIKARWVPEKSEYWMLLSGFPEHGDGCHTDDLFFSRSSDGVHWTTYSEPIIRHGDQDWTATAVYRSTFLYDAATDELRLWISARGTDGAWRVGFARARFTAMMAALETGTGISPRLAVAQPFRVQGGTEAP